MLDIGLKSLGHFEGIEFLDATYNNYFLAKNLSIISCDFI